MNQRQAWILIAALSCACRDPSAVEEDWPPSSVPRGVLLAAPLQIDVDGRLYELETYLWRDFMPVSPPDGRPLAGVFFVGASDQLDAAGDLEVDRAWVVFGEDARQTPVIDQEVPDPPPYRIRRFANGGPKWPPDSLVDVIVRVRSPQSGDVLLRASGQRIHRTD